MGFFFRKRVVVEKIVKEKVVNAYDKPLGLAKYGEPLHQIIRYRGRKTIVGELYLHPNDIRDLGLTKNDRLTVHIAGDYMSLLFLEKGEECKEPK